MNNILIILGLSMLIFLGLFVIPAVMTRWASHRVIRIFRQHGAVNAQDARTLTDLGLAPLGFFDRLMKPRDYKPQALRLLKQAGILRGTADGRFYLSEAGPDEEAPGSRLPGRQIRSVLRRRKESRRAI